MFIEGQKINCVVPQADGKGTVQPGLVMQVMGDKKYKVYVLGVVMLVDEDALTARND